MSKPRVCKDCVKEWEADPPAVPRRPAPHPGPRCATHHRQEKARLKRASHARRVAAVYGLREGQYEQLYAAQGGVCAICRRAKGTVKKLAVDHDHKTGYVRGLLCSVCNKLLGHLRDDPDTAYRIFKYLEDPPAFKEIGMVKPND